MFSFESFLGDAITTSVQQMFTNFSDKQQKRVMFARQANGNSDVKRLSCPELTQLSKKLNFCPNSASSHDLALGSHSNRTKRRLSTPLNIARFRTIVENSDTESTDNNESPPPPIVNRRRSSFYIGTTFEESNDEESDQTTTDLTNVNTVRKLSIINGDSYEPSEVNELSNRRLSTSSTLTVVNDSVNDDEDTFNCSVQPERSLNVLVSLFNSENGTKGLTDDEILSLVGAKVSY